MYQHGEIEYGSKKKECVLSVWTLLEYVNYQQYAMKTVIFNEIWTLFQFIRKEK
jgi:hypothetical protein